jgi:tRNA/tmRNA/rRNA uracil-C5-methylase (TrmA/RlmC/RlmD family)
MTPPAPGSLLTLDIEKPAAGGRMLARHNGQVVLVWGAIPGERVNARVERGRKGVLYAETVEVLSASPDRRVQNGDWRCGGNVFSHVAYLRQLQLKGEIIRDALGRIGHLPIDAAPEVIGSAESGYRMRARLHVRNGRIGFFREGTHELCEPGPTGQLLPETVAWLSRIEQQLGATGLGGLDAMEIAENMPATERAAHLELQGDINVNMLASLSVEGALTGLTAARVNRLGIERLAGVPTITDVLHVTDEDPPRAVRLRRDVRAFFQGNRYLLERLVRHVLALIPRGPLIDLYAGVGLFGLSHIAASGEPATLVEGDAISGADLQGNAEAFGDRAHVHRAAVEGFLASTPPFADATVLVDPPRTGMSREAVSRIIAGTPARVVYVACDVATLARDLRAFIDAGYVLDGLTGFDLFPNTAHVETVAVLRRV